MLVCFNVMFSKCNKNHFTFTTKLKSVQSIAIVINKTIFYLEKYLFVLSVWSVTR